MSGGKRKSLFASDGMKAVLAALLSIAIGMAAGCILIVIVGLCTESLGTKSVWDGVRLVVGGMFINRDPQTGALLFGFNPQMMGNMLFRAMPLIMTGLSVALANKTGLFNIGAPGQFLAGTAATLFIALTLGTGGVDKAAQLNQMTGVVKALAAPGMLMGALPFGGADVTLAADVMASANPGVVLGNAAVLPLTKMIGTLDLTPVLTDLTAPLRVDFKLAYIGLKAAMNVEAAQLGAMPAWLVWTLALIGGMLAGALWGAIPGMMKALLNINEVLACIMTNWIAANLVTWMFDMSQLKNLVENTKSGYIYKTSFNGVQTAKLGLDKIFTGSQVNAGIIIAILFAVVVYIVINKTTFGYELKACGSNRFAARYAGIRDKQSIIISMALAGALAGAGGALYYLSGNTEFFWSTYQSLPAVGFNGIPVALLAVNNPIGVIFTAMFMSMLDICGLQLTNMTGYNEFITDVIIAVIVYLSAFSLLIRLWLGKKRKAGKEGAK